MGRIRSGAGRDDHSRRRAHDSPSTPALSRGAVARRSVPHMPTATTNANAKHGAISTRKQPCALLQYVTSLTSAEHNPQIPPRRQKTGRLVHAAGLRDSHQDTEVVQLHAACNAIADLHFDTYA